MTQRFKQKLNSVFSITNLILMTLQSFLPGFFAFLPTQAYAREIKPMIGAVDLEFAQDTNEFDLEVVSSVNLEYALSYSASDSAQQKGIKGSAVSVDGTATATEYAGTCSTDETCTPDEVKSGTLELPTAGYSADFVIDGDTLWLTSENRATVPTVDLGTIYSAPQNGEVQVVFTKLPENPGSLTIEQITLTEETAKEIGAYSTVAYDITSDMADGTFEYELKLPLPEGADDKAGMVYAESVEELTTATAVETDRVEGKVVTATGLDHFTVFVVTNPVLTPTACVSTGADGCYGDIQAAIDAADPGDVIQVKNGTYVLTSTLNVNEEVKIIGESKAGVIIDASGVSGYGIHPSANNITMKRFTLLPPSNAYPIHVSNTPGLVSNLTLKNITVDGAKKTPFDIHGVDGGLLQNITAKNTISGNGISLTGSSNITLKNITTQNNAWGGIALYNSKYTVPNRETSNITLEGPFNQNESNPLYAENEFGLTIHDIDAQGFNNIVKNPDHRPGGENFVFYQYDLNSAKSYALTLQSVGPNTASTIENIAGDHFYVYETMEIVRALNKVSQDGTVTVFDGSYSEVVTNEVLKNNILVESENGPLTTTINGVLLTGATFDGLTFNGFTFVGDSSGYGNNTFTIDGNGSYKNLRIQSSIFDGESLPERFAIFLNRGFDGFSLINNEFKNYDGSALNTVYSIVFVEAQDWAPTGRGNNFTAQGNSLTNATAVNFIEAFRWQNVLMENNVVNADQGRLLVWSYNSDPVESVIIRNNTINNTSGTGIGTYYLVGTVQITGNVVDGADKCMNISGVEDLTVTNNEFSNCSEKGIQFSDSDGYVNPVSTSINTNIFNSSPIGVENTSTSYEIDVCSNTFNSVTSREYSNPGPFTECVPVRNIAFTNTGTPLIGGTNTDIDLEVEATYTPYGVERVRFRYAPEGETCKMQYKSPYPNDLGDGIKNGDLYSVNWDVTGLDTGTYTVCALMHRGSGMGSEGYVAVNHAEFTVKVDNTAPVVEITNPTDGSQVSGVVDIKGWVSDTNLSHYNISIYPAGVDVNDFSNRIEGETVYTSEFSEKSLYSWDTTGYSDGDYQIRLAARDLAGNRELGGDSEDVIQVSVDNSVNTPVITAPTTGDYFNTFTIRAEWDEVLDESGIDKYEIKYDYLVNGVPTTAYRTVAGNRLYRDQGLSGTVQGEFTIMVRAYDNLGNVSEWSAPVSYVFDSLNPSSEITTFDLPDEGSVETATFSGQIQGTATDENSGVKEVLLEIKHTPFGATESSYWNGSDWQTGVTQVTATGTTAWSYQIAPEEKVLEGTYVVTSHAVDNAGNVESTYTITIVYDKTIPEVTLTIDPTSPDGANGWYVSQPTVTFTANDNYNVDYIEYQWNTTTAGNWITYTGPINPPSEGQNILYYRSVDVVGNISDLGVKDVKFDTVAPTQAPFNVRVQGIKSTTATGKWDRPDESDDINEYNLSWRHEEDGTEYSKTVSSETFEAELDNLYDGIWIFTVSSTDAAGHRKSASTDFRVGAEPSDGTVLGATTDEQSGLGGLVAGVSNFVNRTGQADAETTEKAEDSDKNAAATTETEGSVLGDSDANCVAWKFYLPLFLLIIQIMLAFSLEIANREAGSRKVVMALGISALTIAGFFLLRDMSCYTDGSLMQMLAKWFIPISVIAALFFRGIGSVTVEEN